MTKAKTPSKVQTTQSTPGRKKYFGKNIHRLGTVSSTQDELRRLFLQGAPEGTIVVAEDQERGRGRREKSWHSQSGRGLWMSVLLQPEGKPEQWTWTPLWAGLVVRRAVADLLNSQFKSLAACIRLKWPNDVLLDERKLGGILAEQAQDQHGRQAIVLGIGINLLQRPEDFLPHLRPTATSLLMASGESFDLDAMFEKMILSLEDLYPLLKPIVPEQISQAFLRHAWGAGEKQRVMVSGRQEEGVFDSLGPNGEICLRGSDGGISSFINAEQIERA